MARGQEDSSDNPEDGPILSPEELDISDDEHVTEIDDGRYVVSPNDPISDSAGTTSDTELDAGQSEPAATTDDERVELDHRTVHQWLTGHLEDANSRYGFDMTAKFDGRVQQRQMMSNDVVTIFESLMLWYAQQIDSGTPVEEILGILLMESNVPIRYPPASLQNVLDATDLTPEDSIADLIEAVSEDDGLQL